MISVMAIQANTQHNVVQTRAVRLDHVLIFLE